jgi:methylphosphotriester-DNA--protein-cysteine methyltransferase
MIRIEQLAAELGWSRKRLWAQFHSQIGLPPKRAAKLVRFDHAVHGLVAGQDTAAVAPMAATPISPTCIVTSCRLRGWVYERAARAWHR